LENPFQILLLDGYYAASFQMLAQYHTKKWRYGRVFPGPGGKVNPGQPGAGVKEQAQTALLPVYNNMYFFPGGLIYFFYSSALYLPGELIFHRGQHQSVIRHKFYPPFTVDGQGSSSIAPAVKGVNLPVV
jgi:hypothetical protein